MDFRNDFDDEPDPHKICRDCRRNGNEFYKAMRTYCKIPEELCIYREKNPDLEGDYRCMMLEKQI